VQAQISNNSTNFIRILFALMKTTLHSVVFFRLFSLRFGELAQSGDAPFTVQAQWGSSPTKI
jgi:hypothetical protein